MIEIIVREFLESPHVVRMPGRLPQVHIAPEMQLDQIKKDLAEELSTAEYQKFEKLWTEDSYPREYLHEGAYLRIMDKKL
jgi:hypothetical protein